MLILTLFTCVFLCFSERISEFEFMNLSGSQAHSEVGKSLPWEVNTLSRHLTCLGFERTYSTRNFVKSRKCLEHGFAQQRFHSKMGDLALYSMDDSKTFWVSSFEASGFSQPSQSAMPHDAKASFVGSSCAAASTYRTTGEMLETCQRLHLRTETTRAVCHSLSFASGDSLPRLQQQSEVCGCGMPFWPGKNPQPRKSDSWFIDLARFVQLAFSIQIVGTICNHLEVEPGSLCMAFLIYSCPCSPCPFGTCAFKCNLGLLQLLQVYLFHCEKGQLKPLALTLSGTEDNCHTWQCVLQMVLQKHHRLHCKRHAGWLGPDEVHALGFCKAPNGLKAFLWKFPSILVQEISKQDRTVSCHWQWHPSSPNQATEFLYATKATAGCEDLLVLLTNRLRPLHFKSFQSGNSYWTPTEQMFRDMSRI